MTRVRSAQADAQFEQLDAELSTRQEAVESARLTYEESDRVRAARDEQRVLDTARQHCEFALNSNRERELDLARGAEAASADAQRLADEIAKADDELKRLDDGAARAGLPTGCRVEQRPTSRYVRHEAVWTTSRNNCAPMRSD